MVRILNWTSCTFLLSTSTINFYDICIFLRQRGKRQSTSSHCWQLKRHIWWKKHVNPFCCDLWLSTKWIQERITTFPDFWILFEGYTYGFLYLCGVLRKGGVKKVNMVPLILLQYFKILRCLAILLDAHPCKSAQRYYSSITMLSMFS